jgi:hypothetical protein
MSKPVAFVEKMNPLCTPRKCADCLNEFQAAYPATHWRFKANEIGGKNKGSRRPVCDMHAK